MAILGRVTLKDGGFHARCEQLRDHTQLPQFLPRTKWPSDYALSKNSSTAIKQPIALAGVEVTALTGQLCHRPEGMYQYLSPMPPFDNNRREYFDAPWAAHLALCHNILHVSLKRTKPLERMDMGALLRIVSYGMQYSTAIFDSYHVSGLPLDYRRRFLPRKFERSWDETFHKKMLSGEPNFDYGDKCKPKLWRKRWVVVPITYGSSDATNQWGMTIFDRQKGHLYIFDCGEDEFRKQRVKACVHFWMRFWNQLGMANTFHYFVPDVSQQPNMAMSGYLSIIWLMNTLRNQVGEYMCTLDEGVERIDYNICEPDFQEFFQSGLPLRDWWHDSCWTLSSATKSVKRILNVMLCNELGLKTHEVMTKQYFNPRNNLEQYPSAWDLLSEVIREIDQNRGRVSASKFWTAHGGPQFALPQRTAVRPYEQLTTRRFRMTHDGDQYIEVGADNLSSFSCRYERPRWLPGIVHTPATPVTASLTPVLQVVDVEQLPDSSSPNKRNVRLWIENSSTEPGYESMLNQIDITLCPKYAPSQPPHTCEWPYVVSAQAGENEPVSLGLELPLYICKGPVPCPDQEGDLA